MGKRLCVPNSCMAVLEQDCFLEVSPRAVSGQVSPEEVAAQCGPGDLGQILRGVEEVDLDSSSSRPAACKVTMCGYCPLSPSLWPPWVCRAPEGIRTLNIPCCRSRHWEGSSSGCLPPGSWTFLCRRKWTGCSWHPSPYSPWAFNRATEEEGGVWGLGRGQGWSRVGRGLAQASGQGRRARQAEVWLRKKSHYVNHWWLMFIDERGPEVVSLSLVNSSAIVQCLGWSSYSLPWAFLVSNHPQRKSLERCPDEVMGALLAC